MRSATCAERERRDCIVDRARRTTGPDDRVADTTIHTILTYADAGNAESTTLGNDHPNTLATRASLTALRKLRGLDEQEED